MRPLTTFSIAAFIVWLIGIIPVQNSDLDRGTRDLYMMLPILLPLALGVVLFSLVWLDRQYKRLRP